MYQSFNSWSLVDQHLKYISYLTKESADSLVSKDIINKTQYLVDKYRSILCAPEEIYPTLNNSIIFVWGKIKIKLIAEIHVDSNYEEFDFKSIGPNPVFPAPAKFFELYI